jgi:hypothetical protein
MNEPLIQNVKATDEPETPLGEHAQRMMADLPEGVRAIVMLTGGNGEGMTASKGYAETVEDERENAARMVTDLMGHATAVLVGLDSHLGVVLVPKDIAEKVGPVVNAHLIPMQKPDERPGMYL